MTRRRYMRVVFALWGAAIVPVVPTEAMIKAGEDAIPAGHGQAWLFAKDCYAAMIAAGGVG